MGLKLELGLELGCKDLGLDLGIALDARVGESWGALGLGSVGAGVSKSLGKRLELGLGRFGFEIGVRKN